MRLSDLQIKDVIAIKDGKRIGRIIDAEIDISQGRIQYLVVEPHRFIRSIIINNKETAISFSQINTIGEDVILVDLK